MAAVGDPEIEAIENKESTETDVVLDWETALEPLLVGISQAKDKKMIDDLLAENDGLIQEMFSTAPKKVQNAFTSQVAKFKKDVE
jgi:hypothetical protein